MTRSFPRQEVSDIQRWFSSLEEDQQERWVDRWATGQPVDDLIHTLPPGHRPSDDEPWVLIIKTAWQTGSLSGPGYQMTKTAG
jgi:hypothetical protein